MSEENLKLWNEVARPPTSALKTIKGGRLSGMSNISPQWRWKIMTEKFGMIGFGWKYNVDKIWTSPGAGEEQFAFASVSLYVRIGDDWSHAIPGEGGSMLVSKESKGLHNNDEAFKMAVTDALGTAMAKLGVGADIYLGTFDGSKYNEPVEFPKTANTKKEAQKAAEVTPTKSSPPVDQAFPKGLTKKELRVKENIEAIKATSDADTATILTAINGLDDNQTYTVEQVVKLIKGEGSDE